MKQESLREVSSKVIEAGVPGPAQVSRATLETVVTLDAGGTGKLGPQVSFAATWAAYHLGLYEKALAGAERLGGDWYQVVPPDVSDRTRSTYAAILAEAYLVNGWLLKATNFSRMAVELLDEDECDQAALRAHSLFAACLSLWEMPDARVELDEALRHLEAAGSAVREAPWTLKFAVTLLNSKSDGEAAYPPFEASGKLLTRGGIGRCPFEWMIGEISRTLESLMEGSFQSTVAIVEAAWHHPSSVPIPPLFEDLLLTFQSLAHAHSNRFFTAAQLLEGKTSRPGHSVCLEVPRSMALLAMGNPRSLLWATQECVAPDSDHHLGSLIFILMQRALAHEALDNAEAADREFSRSCHLLVEAGPLKGIPRPSQSAFEGLLARLEKAEPRFFSKLMPVLEQPQDAFARLLRPVNPPAQFPKLSYSEFTVAQWLAADMTLAQIAKKLNLSVNTVKTHSRAVYSKVGAHSRAEAVEHLERVDFPLRGRH